MPGVGCQFINDIFYPAHPAQGDGCFVEHITLHRPAQHHCDIFVATGNLSQGAGGRLPEVTGNGRIRHHLYQHHYGFRFFPG